MSAPSVIEHQLVFTLDDPMRAFVQVGLDCDDALAGPRRFRRTAAGWGLAIPRPDVARVEYRLVVTPRKGLTSVVCDPDNPNTVRTAFGERSVALMPGYERPGWLQRPVEPGELIEHVYVDDSIGQLPLAIWTPSGLNQATPAPLLMVNDGPEYLDLAALGHYAAAMVEDGTLPPFRMALMQPLQRDEWYGANPAYIAASISAVRSVVEEFPVRGPFVLLGASLGGLCALLTATEAPPDFPVSAVVSQSGSFFQRRLDPQESSYPFFARVTAAVTGLLNAGPARTGLMIGMTCGALEENLANNQAMALALSDQGHHVVLREMPDLHNYTAWRDALDPTLTEVLRQAWGARG